MCCTQGPVRPTTKRDVTAIAERLKKDKIGLLILTTTILGPRHASRKIRSFGRLQLAPYAASRRSTRQQSRRGQQRSRRGARADGQDLMEADQVHLNFAGYRRMARAVLDALGRPKSHLAGEAHTLRRCGD